MEDLISVVIPVYNGERFVSNAIQSIINQSYSNWELIIVENGSKDRTTEVCESFLCDKRIHLFHSEKGVTQARNKGIEESNGKWIAFLDADDQLVRDGLKEWSSVVNKYNCDIVSAEYVSEGVKFSSKITVIDNNDDFLENSLSNPTQKANIAGILFSRSFLIDNIIRFRQGLTHAEDSVFFLDTVLQNPRICLLDFGLYKYSYSKNSTVRSSHSNLELAYIPSMKKIYELVQGQSEKVRNAAYLLVLNNLLVIFVHDTFIEGYSTTRAKKICELPVFKEAILNVDICNITGAKKIIFYCLKKGLYWPVLLACKIRIYMNKRKEVEL